MTEAWTPMGPEPLVPAAFLPPPVERWALFLDIDGTLLDIAATPETVTVSETLRATLTVLQEQLSGAVALVSGRSIGAIDRLFAPLRFTIGGQHGAELRRQPGGTVETLVEPERVAAIAAELRGLAEEFPGVEVEEKGLSIAIHFRNAPAAETPTWDAATAAAARSDGFLEVLRGKMVWDLRPHDVTKGTAIEMLLADPPFAGRVPVFLGDDRTDEDGFAAVSRLGGAGILVGLPRPTLAQFRLPDPEACRAWLDRVATER